MELICGCPSHLCIVKMIIIITITILICCLRIYTTSAQPRPVYSSLCHGQDSRTVRTDTFEMTYTILLENSRLQITKTVHYSK